ncbi:MAG: ATP-binding protein [Prevotella sp.]|nr:ATP-binding protein [Prevotella sp.]
MKKEIQIRNQVDDLQHVAAFVEEIADELQLSPELTMNFNLVLEEMVSNVIFYAYPKENDQPIILTATSDDDSISFIITDEGRAFDPTAREDADMSVNPADRQLGGMGIFITRQIMDDVTYQRIDGCNILTMTKRLKD